MYYFFQIEFLAVYKTQSKKLLKTADIELDRLPFFLSSSIEANLTGLICAFLHSLLLFCWLFYKKCLEFFYHMKKYNKSFFDIRPN